MAMTGTIKCKRRLTFMCDLLSRVNKETQLATNQWRHLIELVRTTRSGERFEKALVGGNEPLSSPYRLHNADTIRLEYCRRLTTGPIEKIYRLHSCF